MPEDAGYKQYKGQPCVTLANNYYKDTVTRAPALCRYGYFHSLNNYVYNFSMGYTVYTACDIYAENCYYDGASLKGNVICDWGKPPYPGTYAEGGSIFKNCGRTRQGQGSSSMPVYSTPCKWRPNQNYTYKALTAEQAKASCSGYSGSQAAASMMYYAAFSNTGVPSAFYTEAPAEQMDEPVTEPVTEARTTEPTEPVMISGDVNADGRLDILDVIALQKWLLCTGTLENGEAADVNADGCADIFDLALMKTALLRT